MDVLDLGFMALNWQTNVFGPLFSEELANLGLPLNVPEPSILAGMGLSLVLPCTTRPRRRG